MGLERILQQIAQIESRISEIINQEDGPDADYSEIESLADQMLSHVKELTTIKLQPDQREQVKTMLTNLQANLQDRLDKMQYMHAKLRSQLVKVTKGVKGMQAYNQIQYGNKKK